MSREWIENEDGPVCSCGEVQTVKKSGDDWGLLCFGHTSESGGWRTLPKQAPDEFTQRVGRLNAKFDELESNTSNGVVAPEEAAEIFGPYFDEFYEWMASEVEKDETERQV